MKSEQSFDIKEQRDPKVIVFFKSLDAKKFNLKAKERHINLNQLLKEHFKENKYYD